MNLFRSVTKPKERSVSLDQLAAWFQYNGTSYPLSGYQQTLAGSPAELPDPSYAGYAQSMYKGNGVVYACMRVRRDLFSEVRFQYQQVRNGKPGKLFGTQDLGILEEPWPNGTTGDLLARAIQDADLAGNFYCVRDGNQLRRLHPQWVTIILASPSGTPWDTDVIGYEYKPGGSQSTEKAKRFLVEEVCHFAPSPDPEAKYRGMSWLTPVIREVMGDKAMTEHKLTFMEQGATPNVIVALPESVRSEQYNHWVDIMSAKSEGIQNAYKTMYLGGGSTAQVVGANFKEIDFKVTQGAGEVRIAAAAGVHPTIVGLSEGLQGSSLNAGNFSAARRLLADATLRTLWRNFCGSIQTIVPAPGGSRLWYDPSDIAFLQEDVTDAATIHQTNAATIHSLVSSGYTPESVIEAVTSGDFSVLQHTGLYSVQLLPAGSVTEGKGSLVQGTVGPSKQPALKAAGQRPNGQVRALLTPFIAAEEEIV